MSDVVTLDLHGLGSPEALDRAETLLDTERDVTLLLVLDSAEEVCDHRGTYEWLLRSRRVESHLCVVTGRQNGTGRLRLPTNIQQSTLWVPDPAGVDWPYRAAAAAKQHTDAAESGLTRLVEVVRLPEVFLRTIELVREIPYGAACPGLRLADDEAAAHDEFPWALRTALDQLVAPSDEPEPPAADIPADHSGASARAIEGGRLDRSIQEARGAVEEAQRAARALTERQAVFGARQPIVELMRTAAERLGTLRGEFERLISDVATNENPGRVISDAGLVVPEVADLRLDEVRTAVDTSTRTWLEHGASLPQIEESVRHWAVRTGGDGAHGKALARVLPDRLLDLLASPVPFPAPQPWLPVAGAVVAALAGLGPSGATGGGLMALLWAILVLLTVTRVPNRRKVDHLGALLVNLLAAAAGGVAGGFLGATGIPKPIWGAALALGLVGAVVMIVVSFRSRARRWVLEAGIERALQAVEELAALIGRIGAEWAGLDARAAARDALSRFQHAVRGVTKALNDHNGELRRTLQPNGRGPLLTSGYLASVQQQLVALVVTALRPALDAQAEEDPEACERDAELRAQRLLVEWAEHVDRHGTVEPPPFAIGLGVAAASDTSEDLAQLTRAAGYDPTQEMWQLCSAGDLTMLDVTPGAPATVRFAPRRARPAFGSTVPPDTVWGRSAHSGVLRLTPLRAGIVQWSWTDEVIDEPEDDLNGDDGDLSQ